MVDARDQLKKMITTLSFKERDEPFTLRSGRKSRVYFDLRPLLLRPFGLSLAVDEALLVLDYHCGSHTIDAVAGILDGGASAATLAGMKVNKPILLVRKKAKAHGTGGGVMGLENVGEGYRVAVFEDVTTTGGSALRGVRALREAGLEVPLVVSVLDREEGGREALADANVTLLSLFKKRDFSDLE